MEPENRIATATILALQAAVRMLIDEVETGHQGSAARTLALSYARRVLSGDIQRRDAPSIYPQADEAPIERPSRSERQMRNMEADAAAVLQARDEEIARLRETLRAVLPYAHSRGEDLHEFLGHHANGHWSEAERAEHIAAWQRCDEAVTRAYALLGEKP